MSFDLGHIKPILHTNDELVLIESGTVYITNKKIILIGVNGTKRILLNNIVDTEINFSRNNEILLIKKETGKDVHLTLGLTNTILVNPIIEGL